MLARRHVVLAICAMAAAALVQTASAAAIGRFASANFAAANKAGDPVVVHIDATWCPTCKAQKPVLAKLLAGGKYAGFKGFYVDYDSEKPVMRELSAPDRSTILVFAKGKEVARSVGDTSEEKIAALLDKAL
ncbi:thioredoxin family protein [Methylopila sp. M107]|uniref:thioredoxin family protein n=1 Tax=Methylopila sp. M107 TaxID=1101190 RepID=UPI00036EBE67|nr:thioredoxin family protein [Methylopila sp. M107]